MRLAQAEDWLHERQADLSLSEQDFIVQSVQLQTQLRARQRRQTIVMLVFGMMATLIFAGAATLQWWQAEEQGLLVTRIKDESLSVTFSPRGKLTEVRKKLTANC